MPGSWQIAPYLTTLINGAGWKADFPRVMTDEDIEGLIQRSHGAPKLAAVQDVTCDLKVCVVMKERGQLMHRGTLSSSIVIPPSMSRTSRGRPASSSAQSTFCLLNWVSSTLRARSKLTDQPKMPQNISRDVSYPTSGISATLHPQIKWRRRPSTGPRSFALEH